jgi:peptidoglycan biosynthesis protein MviN/MurJ (putative lipid II flippase)
LKWKLKDEKIVGYILLTIGIILIFFSIYQMMNVFTGASPPPSLFNFSDIHFPGPEGSSILMVSGKELNKLAAMAFWYMLMFFIMWAGGKIASLGVNLIKEIRVEMKEPLKKTEEKETGKTEEKKEA